MEEECHYTVTEVLLQGIHICYIVTSSAAEMLRSQHRSSKETPLQCKFGHTPMQFANICT